MTAVAPAIEHPAVLVDWVLDCPCGFPIAKERESLTGAGYIGGPVVAAVLPVRGTWDEFMEGRRRYHKGVVVKDAERAAGLYTFEPFTFECFLSDVEAIHKSKAERQGKPMKVHYLWNARDRGGDRPLRPWTDPPCAHHQRVSWGAFRDGHLYGYITWLGLGDWGLYTMIIGHGDHLASGMMYALHFEVARWLWTRESRPRHIVYAGYYQGTDGLQLWKRKAGFSPAVLSEGA